MLRYPSFTCKSPDVATDMSGLPVDSVATLVTYAFIAAGIAAVLMITGFMMRGQLKSIFEARYDTVSGSAASYHTQRETAFPVHVGRVVSKWVAILGFAGIALSERVAGIAIDTVLDGSST